MWPWLQKRLSKKALLLSKLVGFAISMHLLIFLCSIVIYHFRSETRLTINIAQRLNTSDATVVVLPFQKQVKQAMYKVARLNRSNPSTSSGRSVKKKNIPVRGEPVESIRMRKKTKAPTTLVQAKSKPKPKPQKKVQPKKVVAKKPAKKPEAKTPTKKIVKKSTPNKPVVKKSNVAKPVQKNHELPALKMAKAQVPEADKSVVYIGRQDAQLLKIHEQIVEEIHKHWRPPVGISNDCMCELKVAVNGTGTVTRVNVEKPSGVLVYDISARSAVLAMNIPKWAWGKELMIAFNQ